LESILGLVGPLGLSEELALPVLAVVVLEVDLLQGSTLVV